MRHANGTECKVLPRMRYFLHARQFTYILWSWMCCECDQLGAKAFNSAPQLELQDDVESVGSTSSLPSMKNNTENPESSIQQVFIYLIIDLFFLSLVL
jgi:hypothetical protein